MGVMSNADDTASHFAMTSAELLNGIAFLLTRESGRDEAAARDTVALLRTALREQVDRVAAMRPGRIEGPAGFDIKQLEVESRQLLVLLDRWDDPAAPVPDDIRSCAIRMMRAMGFSDSQLEAFATS